MANFFDHAPAMRQRFLAQTTLKMATHFTMKYIEGHQSLANINENNTYSQFAGPAGYSNTSSQHTLREILVYCLKKSLRFNIGP